VPADFALKKQLAHNILDLHDPSNAAFLAWSSVEDTDELEYLDDAKREYPGFTISNLLSDHL
jgi:hypothetical protein